MIGGFRYAVIDFETTVFESYKRKANPFDKRNKVIVSVFKLGTDTEVTTKYDRSGIDKFDDLPFDKFDVLVGQNMKFDLLYLWGSQRLREWLRNGGRIFDTMVAEYLLTGQQSMYASLDKLALKYGGEVKDNRLSEMFEAGIGADKIDPDILLPYAQGDILNTEIAFLGQLEALKRTAMTPLVWGYMDHLLALTEMEFNGMYFDLEAANTLREDLNKQYEDLRKRFQEVVDGYAKTPVVFNPDKPEHISALLYNTPIKVVTREQIGVFSDKCSKAGQPRYKVTREVVFLDMPNIHSAKGVREYKKKGVYASDNSILLTLKERCQGDTGATSILDGILKYREVKKLLTTYLYSVNLKTGKESGLIPLVNKLDGCIHGNLGMVGTVTGRLNSSNPNMQNIPTSLKKLFISRFGKHGQIVEFDYCLTPDMRVLTEEFKWVRISEIEEGTTLIGFPEETKIHEGATFLPTLVEKKKTLKKEVLEITTSEGVVKCSVDHMWRASTGTNPLKWKKASELKIGWSLSKVMEVWDTPNNQEVGWMAGFLDGEGYISNNSQIGVGQNADGDNALCFNEAARLFKRYMPHCELRFADQRRCVKMRPAGLRTGWQAVGIFQPLRLKAKLLRGYSKTSIRSRNNRKGKIISIRSLGVQEVVALQTSTKTFLAEGFLSHNCQLEVCNQAYVTQSPKMIQDIKDGVDFHVKRLAYAEETSYDKIKENLKRHPEVWGPKRRAAKIISFQKAYGAGIEKISEETGLSTATVERVFNEEDKEYPEVRLFGETVMEALKTSRVPTATALPIRYKETGVYFEDKDEKMGIGFFQSITGKQYGFREWGVDSAKLREQGRPIFRYFKATQAANYPVQGLAADILALTVGKVFRYLLKYDPKRRCLMINEVHDSLVLDVEKGYEDMWGSTATNLDKVSSILEDVDGVFNEVLGIRFNVPIKVESVSGKQWGKEETT